jgi:hypothetical protein
MSNETLDKQVSILRRLKDINDRYLKENEGRLQILLDKKLILSNGRNNDVWIEAKYQMLNSELTSFMEEYECVRMSNFLVIEKLKKLGE